MFGGKIGATYLGDGRTRFCVWAPSARKVELHAVAPEERLAPLAPTADGYHEATLEGTRPGLRYYYRLNGREEWPDPASRSQPEGVHGPSEVSDPAFAWTDRHWCGPALSHYILYELHVGTFTEEGTFEAAIARLDELKELGVMAIEIMPVAQFPGGRNWGYDGVYPFAAQNTYGGVDGLRALVDACHARGLAAVLDVVYNHLGPEGNYLMKYGPYFTGRYQTPWGDALNFDGPGSREVRRYFIENALYWLEDCHFDALRLDAIHAIKDTSAYPFLEELAEAVHTRTELSGRRQFLIAESDLNDTRVIQPRDLGGFELDAQWSDDFHHAVHTLLTGEQLGYYQDFGRLAQLVKAYEEGFIYSGEYSECRQNRHGKSSRTIPARKFVVCSQNHDQVGNRMMGERLAALVPPEKQRLAAAAVLLAPNVPLLFMGEEYGETAPFLYFTSHGDEKLVEAVRKGRAEEFASFAWSGGVPDPDSERTFLQSKLNRRLLAEPAHAQLRDYYRELIALRRETPALALLSKDHLAVGHDEARGLLWLRRWYEGSQAMTLFNFSDQTQEALALPLPAGFWHKRLDSQDPRYGGGGLHEPATLASPAGTVNLTLHPHSVVLYVKGDEE